MHPLTLAYPPLSSTWTHTHMHTHTHLHTHIHTHTCTQTYTANVSPYHFTWTSRSLSSAPFAGLSHVSQPRDKEPRCGDALWHSPPSLPLHHLPENQEKFNGMKDSRDRGEFHTNSESIEFVCWKLSIVLMYGWYCCVPFIMVLLCLPLKNCSSKLGNWLVCPLGTRHTWKKIKQKVNILRKRQICSHTLSWLTFEVAWLSISCQVWSKEQPFSMSPSSARNTISRAAACWLLARS